MRDELRQLLDAFQEDCKSVRDESSLQKMRDKYLSREKGLLTAELKKLRSLPPDERPSFGKEVNILKKTIEEKIALLAREVSLSAYREKVELEKIDVTLPPVELPTGTLHPIKQVEAEICEIFLRMGYSIAEGPEIESDFYNFEALNFPPNHPARDAQDTFFIGGGAFLLRTHTSPVQIRSMQQIKPPLKLIAPGKVFRKDTPDATHYPIFHQIEGLVVDTNISLADLKGTLEEFARICFSTDTRVRLRPSFFPFVEPGAEVDISCIFCGGKGCRICKNSGWIEILGAGMVHPKVLENCDIDSEKYTGFAFGMGVDRIAILKYGIPDIRLFWENDVKFLSQFQNL